MLLEQQKLEKLWDAYELQEKDLNAALDQINILEAEIASLQRLLKGREPAESGLSSKFREFDGILGGEQGPAIDKLETQEAIQIHRKLGRMGDVRRLEKLHIKYLWYVLVSKLSDMKAKRIDCTGLEISTSDLNSKLAESFNIKDGK